MHSIWRVSFQNPQPKEDNLRGLRFSVASVANSGRNLNRMWFICEACPAARGICAASVPSSGPSETASNAPSDQPIEVSSDEPSSSRFISVEPSTFPLRMFCVTNQFLICLINLAYEDSPAQFLQIAFSRANQGSDDCCLHNRRKNPTPTNWLAEVDLCAIPCNHDELNGDTSWCECWLWMKLPFSLEMLLDSG